MTKWHFTDSANAAKLPDKNETFKTVKTIKGEIAESAVKAKWSCLPNIEKSEKKRSKCPGLHD